MLLINYLLGDFVKLILAIIYLFINTLFVYADNYYNKSSLKILENEGAGIYETIFIHNDSDGYLEDIKPVWFLFINEFVRIPEKIARFLRHPEHDLSYNIGEKNYIIKHNLVLKWLYEGNAFYCKKTEKVKSCYNRMFSNQVDFADRSNRILAPVLPNKESFRPLSTPSDLVFKNAVLLIFSTEQGFARCSGVALNRFTILTANHCLHNEGVFSSLIYVYFFGRHAKEHIVARGQDWKEFRVELVTTNSTAYSNLIEEGILAEPVDFLEGDIDYQLYHKDQNGKFVSEMSADFSRSEICPLSVIPKNIASLYRPFFFESDDSPCEGIPAFAYRSGVNDISLIVTNVPIVPLYYLFPQISDQSPMEEEKLLNYGFRTQSLQDMMAPNALAEDFFYKIEEAFFDSKNISFSRENHRREIIVKKASIGATSGDSGGGLYRYDEKQRAWDVQGVVSMTISLPVFVELITEKIRKIDFSALYRARKDDDRLNKNQEICDGADKYGSVGRNFFLLAYKDKLHRKEIGDFLYNTTKNENYHPNKISLESLESLVSDQENWDGKFCLNDQVYIALLEIFSKDFRYAFESTDLLAFALSFKEGIKDFAAFATVHSTNLNDFLIQQEAKIIEGIYKKYGGVYPYNLLN